MKFQQLRFLQIFAMLTVIFLLGNWCQAQTTILTPQSGGTAKNRPDGTTFEVQVSSKEPDNYDRDHVEFLGSDGKQIQSISASAGQDVLLPDNTKPNTPYTYRYTIYTFNKKAGTNMTINAKASKQVIGPSGQPGDRVVVYQTVRVENITVTN